MKIRYSLKRLAAAVSLSLCAGLVAAPAPAQQPVQTSQNGQIVQDGISVKPLSRWRYLQPEEQVEQQSAMQYQQLLQSANQQGALYPANHPQVVRLRAIAQRMIPYAPRWNADATRWKWQVNLLNSKQVNAFCMPGGRIAFYYGILDKLKLTDDEIAAVMGHEVAHALREHGRERAGKAAATGIASRLGGAVLSAWLGIDPNITGAATNAAGQMLVLKFSRDEEREADLIGLDLAARAGFDPRAGVTLWRKMNSLNQQQPLQLLSTHPGGQERITQIQNHMNVLLPLYARAKGVAPNQLPAAYR
ncbi:M48 family peptidase [Massilia arenosa]|uniref:M48 family peptidase n=1 Tax=Zemynaea arenosa TaxID=2561931 RepID=A0A4Y9SAN1_9BURK|nr:M48 family metallopeptidase [Massilia arenosa]TFW17229.1 M48 family peptidase [Massilia arenosa]